jgi:hypothetical protein
VQPPVIDNNRKEPLDNEKGRFGPTSSRFATGRETRRPGRDEVAFEKASSRTTACRSASASFNEAQAMNRPRQVLVVKDDIEKGTVNFQAPPAVIVDEA